MSRSSKTETSGGRATIPQNQWGIINFLPERNVEDDDTSIKMFQEYLKLQSRKKEQKQEVDRIQERMDRTLADRRRDIVVETFSIEQIAEAWPILFSEKEVNHTITINASWCVNMSFFMYNRYSLHFTLLRLAITFQH